MFFYIGAFIGFAIIGVIIIGIIYIAGGKKNLDKTIYSLKSYLYCIIALFTLVSILFLKTEISLLNVAIIMVSIVECLGNWREIKKMESMKG